MKPTNTFYIAVIATLMFIVLLQRSSYIPKDAPKVIRDTVYVQIPVHDTIPGKPKVIKIKGPIQWKDSIQFKADTNYARLLKQYDSLGDFYFSQHLYKTDYKLGTYGTASVLDTIVSNSITGTSLSYNLKIPEKTITIHEPYVPKRQLYIGGGLAGTVLNPINYGHVGVLYKDKQDKVFGVSIGFNGQGPVYGMSLYWKIKL